MCLVREGIQIDHPDYAKYYVPAMERITPELIKGDVTIQILTFDRLLGVKLGECFRQRPPRDDRPLPDDWRELLVQLAGPYGLSILKAYRVKYKLERPNE